MPRSRDKESLWQSLKPEQAADILTFSYQEEAAAETLLRAFLAERDCNRAGALFWIAVHGLIANGEGVTRLERLMLDPLDNLEEIAREIGQKDE